MRKLIAVCISILMLLTFASAHPGRTDSAGGHKDNKNASGLGYYHYHHGMEAHLHPNGVCPYAATTAATTKATTRATTRATTKATTKSTTRATTVATTAATTTAVTTAATTHTSNVDLSDDTPVEKFAMATGVATVVTGAGAAAVAGYNWIKKRFK